MNFPQESVKLASHAGVLRGARFSSWGKRAPQKRLRGRLQWSRRPPWNKTENALYAISISGSTVLKLIPTAMIFGTCSDRQGVYINNGWSQIIPFKKVREYSVQIPVRGKLKLSSVTDNNLINSNNSINNNKCNEKNLYFDNNVTASVAGGIAISSFHRHVNSVCRTEIISISWVFLCLRPRLFLGNIWYIISPFQLKLKLRNHQSPEVSYSL